jgi:hypothetical protein
LWFIAVVLGEHRFKPPAKKVVAVVQQQGHWVEVLMAVMDEHLRVLVAGAVVAAQAVFPQLLVLRQLVLLAVLEANPQAAMRGVLEQVCPALTVPVVVAVVVLLLPSAEAMAALYLHGQLGV